MTAQKMFDAIKAGDDGLRMKLNRAAAESDGLEWLFNKGWQPDLPDYSRDLNAVAGLTDRRPDPGSFLGVHYGSCLSIVTIGTTASLMDDKPEVARVNCLGAFTPADEALARLCCLAVAGGWAV